MHEFTSVIQLVIRHQPCGMLRPPSIRISLGRLKSVTAPGGKFEWLAFLFPTIAYEPSRLKTPLVQSTPPPNLPLPVLMPLSLLPVGKPSHSETATHATPAPPAPGPSF